jgi:hypothetical protein
MNRILDIHGRSTMIREEERAKYLEISLVGNPHFRSMLENHAENLIRRGENVEVGLFRT